LKQEAIRLANIVYREGAPVEVKDNGVEVSGELLSWEQFVTWAKQWQRTNGGR
jgi:hypothetical protein